MEISIDRQEQTPIYQQIVRRIRELIMTGALPQGSMLPPERTLARQLGVNRSTVLSAYRELKADDLVDAHVGRGTVVVAPPAVKTAAPARSLPWQQMFREVSGRAQDTLIRDLLAMMERPDAISFSIGLPSPDLMPMDAYRRTLDELVAEIGSSLVMHVPTEGHTPLRETMCSWMAARGVASNPSEILIMSGSQQGLDLIARALLSPGDTIIIEEPSYFGALQVFRSARVRFVGVPVDDQGMRMDLLAAALERHKPKLIYTLPTFQNPSGATMSLERRKMLLELAWRHAVPVVEDDPYSELRYEGEHLPSLKALDDRGHVIYSSTFSKILFPGLRLGWLVAPRPVIRQLALAKQSMDLHSNGPGQWVVDRMIRRGIYERHLRTIIGAYGRRRDIMDAALRRDTPDGLTWRTPQGGFYIWCRLPERTDRSRLLAQAAEAGVAFLPGWNCFLDDPASLNIRLNFTFLDEEKIGDGVARLLEAVRRVSSKHHISSRMEAGLPPIV